MTIKFACIKWQRARLPTEQVLEGWEDFEVEVEDCEELDTITEPVMRDFEEMLAEEEEHNYERVETEIVQEVQREDREVSVCMVSNTFMGGDDVGTLTEEPRTDDDTGDTNGVDTTQSLPLPLPRDGACPSIHITCWANHHHPRQSFRCLSPHLHS